MKKKWSDKYKKSINCDNPKGFSQKAHCQGKKKVEEETNPRIPRKKGQPANSKKHSDLYTDENPKGTIHGLGFKDVATAKASVSKIRNSSRSHAHKIQAAVAMEQRAREMGKTSEAAVYRKYINSMKKKTKKMNEEAVSKKQQKFFGIVRAIQKGEAQPTTPETAKAAESMTKKDVKKFASTKHKGLPEKKEVKEMKGYGEERFCELCGKKEYREECSYGPKMWDMFTIKDFSKSVVVPGKATYEERKISKKTSGKVIKAVSEYKPAKFVNDTKLMPGHGIDKKLKEEDMRSNWRQEFKEEGLRAWFGKSKSKGGKPGWVQVVSGKPCARQPGQKTTPKCVSSAKRASMTEKERKSAQRRKRAADPGQPQKTGAAKPTYVSTDKKKPVKEAYLRVQERGRTYTIVLNWRGKSITTQMFFAKFSRPTKEEVVKEIRKIYPNAIVLYYNPVMRDPTLPLLFAGEPNESRRN